MDKFVDLGEQLKGQKSLAFDEVVDGVRLRGELGPFVDGRQLLYRCVEKKKLKEKIICGFGRMSSLALRKVRFSGNPFLLSGQKIHFFLLSSGKSLSKEFVELYRAGMGGLPSFKQLVCLSTEQTTGPGRGEPASPFSGS